MGNDLKIQEFKSVINDGTIRAQVKNSLKENSGAFLSSMLDLYSGDDYLQRCDPRAVAMECLKAASLKLPLIKSLGFAYVVPYGNIPTFIVGYKGLIQLAQRSKEYKTINADVVYEGEFVGKNKLTGRIDMSGEKTSDEVVGYFAYLELINGFEKTLYMSKEEVMAWRDLYSKTKSQNTPWFKEFDKMAMKTVLRRLIGTYGPMTNEMQSAFESETPKQRLDKEVSANANKKPLDFEDAQVVEDAQLSEPPDDVKADIEAQIAAESAPQMEMGF